MTTNTITVLRDEHRDRLIRETAHARLDSEAMLASIATEFAMGINDAASIIRNHGLSQADFDQIARIPRFQQLLSDANLAWNSSEKATTRIRVKMETALETALPHLFRELIAEGLSGPKVELIKAIMKGTGLGEENKANAAVGSGVKIVINTGGPQAGQVSIDQVTIDQVTIDHAASDAEEV